MGPFRGTILWKLPILPVLPANRKKKDWKFQRTRYNTLWRNPRATGAPAWEIKMLSSPEGSNVLSFIQLFNHAIFLILTSMYFYQAIYIVVTLVKNRQDRKEIIPKKLHTYAAVIAARNESAVIGGLIRSIRAQNYPAELVDIYVVADNCTDDTAQIARNEGVTVYERSNKQAVGKGYALNYLFNLIENSETDKHYDGYFIFDADNVLDENYVAEMNKVFDSGYRILTSYRNSKNYGSNWISAGYALWFLRESAYLNAPRMMLGTSCAVSGTGFLVSGDIIRANGGWKHHLLTEDIEFSVDQVIQGENIGYCGDAILYDEQPCTFEQSWNQRLRWAKGFYQVFRTYGANLLKALLAPKRERRFSCYDILMTVSPAMLLFLFSICVNSAFFFYGLFDDKMNMDILGTTGVAVLWSLGSYYLTLFGLGLLTTITEHKRIACPRKKLVRYLFTFPIFILTYIPISIVALFRNVEWKPIVHTFSVSPEQIRNGTAHMNKG